MTRQTKVLLRVFSALLALLALTVVADLLPLGVLHTPVALLIAIAKAGLIAWFFMEIHGQSSRVRFLAAAGLIWLIILFLLTASDYATRGWHWQGQDSPSNSSSNHRATNTSVDE